MFNAVSRRSQGCVINGNYTEDDFQKVVDALVKDNPEFFYLNVGEVRYSKKGSSNGRLTLKYYWKNSECENLINKIHKNVQKILSEIIHEGMSESERARSIHDKLAMNVEYDKSANAENPDSIDYVFALLESGEMGHSKPGEKGQRIVG